MFVACHQIDPRGGELFHEIWNELSPQEIAIAKQRLKGRPIESLSLHNRDEAREELFQRHRSGRGPIENAGGEASSTGRGQRQPDGGSRWRSMAVWKASGSGVMKRRAVGRCSGRWMPSTRGIEPPMMMISTRSFQPALMSVWRFQPWRWNRTLRSTWPLPPSPSMSQSTRPPQSPTTRFPSRPSQPMPACHRTASRTRLATTQDCRTNPRPSPAWTTTRFAERTNALTSPHHNPDLTNERSWRWGGTQPHENGVGMLYTRSCPAMGVRPSLCLVPSARKRTWSRPRLDVMSNPTRSPPGLRGSTNWKLR